MSSLVNVIHPVLSGDSNIVALIKAMDDPWNEICNQVIQVLIYPRIDSLSEEVVDLLAFQFHLEGYRLATTLSDKREMVKNAILLHRHKGTPWAVKQSLVSAGYRDAIIQEPQRYDGKYKYDGTIKYDSPGDFQFRVLLDLGNYKGIDAQLTADIIQCINDYKNARSHLIGLRFKSVINDEVPVSDTVMPITSIYRHRYNGTYKYNGQINYSGQHQVVEQL